ncbi:hypothetical protein, partial [Sinimarinibacterium flocculans]
LAKIRRVRRSTLGHIGLLLSKDQVSARTGQLQTMNSFSAVIDSEIVLWDCRFELGAAQQVHPADAFAAA